MSKGSFFSGGTPLRRIFIVLVGALLFLGLTGFLLWQDFSRFLGPKPLPIPPVTALGKGHFEDLTRVFIAGFFGGSKTQLNLAQANAVLLGANNIWGKTAEGQPTKPYVYLTDGKGKLVTLVSVPVGENKFFNAVLLFGPDASSPPTTGTLGAPMVLTKTMANGKELPAGAMQRFTRLIRIAYTQILAFLVSGKESRTSSPSSNSYLDLNTVPTKPVEVRYAKQTMYFNGYEP